MAKSLIVLIIDHESFKSEEGEDLTPEFLHEISRQEADMASHICGMEGWMEIYKCSSNLLKTLGSHNQTVNTIDK